MVKKPKLRPKKVKQAAQKRCFGKSIDERPVEAKLHSEIGHFEIDTIKLTLFKERKRLLIRLSLF